MRDYWRGEEAKLGEFAYRFTGSSDLYESDGRRPMASINFITAHDGFTLNDLVSFNDKHNEANGEDNRDGESHNRSWNCGVEGDTDDPAVLALRERQKRNFLTTLFLSQGVPMLLGGDEMQRTQHGNNNAYCQDNELSWFDWSARDRNLAHLIFTRRLIHLRRGHPVLRRRRWFQGRALHGSGVSDIAWFNVNGSEMTEEQWNEGSAKSLAVFMNGQEIPSRGPRGERIIDDSLLLFFNAHSEALAFTVPAGPWGERWDLLLDTNEPETPEGTRTHRAGEEVIVEGRAVVVLRRGA
jgi:glycogen operon protein